MRCRHPIAVGLILLSFAASAQETQRLLPWNLPFLGVHRGGAAWRPEHTMEAYRDALKAWPTALLECDARVTRDGVVVLNHDETVDRTTNGSGPIADMTLEQVKALDAGFAFSRDHGATYPYRGKGLTIATLEELLTTFPESPVLIELKDQPGVAKAVATVIQRCHAQDRVLIAAFPAEQMAQFAETLPDVPTCFNTTSGMRLLGAMRGDGWAAYQPEATVLALGIKMVQKFAITPEDVAKLHDKGVDVQVYDVETPVDLDHVRALGADGILTDNPDVVAPLIDAPVQAALAR